ncbi:MAG: hypothetical protein KDK89_10980 [Alphaproteobacteria bacterium]|nr:hypothetical protein [Alphaproteobacteria bacterium]
MIIVCPLNKAESLVTAHAASHVISLLGPDTPHRTFAGIGRERHLRLTFHDVSVETPGLSAPQTTDAERLISFIAGWSRAQPMLIHCWAGISRSTAAAYAALCLLRPDTSEDALAQELRAASPSATPNRMIVGLVDQALGREGRMLEAIASIGRGADAFEGTPFIVRP